MTVPAVVLILLSQLGSDSYRRRERAHLLLLELAPWADAEIRSALTRDDPEMRQRSYEILSDYYRRTAESKASQLRPPCGYPRLPWLDMLPEYQPNQQATINYYLGQARKHKGRKSSPKWEEYRLATRIYAVELLSDPNTADSVGPLLDQMVVREIEWIERNRHRYSPPLPAPGR